MVKQLMATLGRTLGPFGDERAAYEAADQAGLKLQLTLVLTFENLQLP